LGYSPYIPGRVFDYILFCFPRTKKNRGQNKAQLYEMYEEDLEDLWRDYQTRMKQTYQGLTGDG